MNPQMKQWLSGLGVAVLGAACVAVEQAIATPPFTLHSLLVAASVGAFAGLVHRLPALGTAQATEAKVQTQVAERVSAIVDGEPK